MFGISMTTYNYYIKEGIKEARKLYRALEEKNTVFGNGQKAYRENGDPGPWDIKTPVFEFINSECQHNLISMASEIAFGAPNKIKNTALNHHSGISAYCKRREDSASIVVTKDNYCWQRYFISKEILHLFIHDEANKTDTESLLKELITDLLECDPTLDGDNPQYNADKAAYFGAIELLLPTEYVPSLIEAKNMMIDQGTCVGDENLEIARMFSVPEKLVEFRLDERHQHIFDVDSESEFV